MNSEDTVLDNLSNKDEETVVNNAQNNEETIANNAESVEVKSNEKEHSSSGNGNKRKRAAAVTAGVGVAASAAAGAYFMNNGNSEDMITEPTSEQMETEEQTANVQSQLHHTTASAPTPEPEPIVESTSNSAQSVASDALVAEPDVEILGVEVVNTENGDVTLGGVTVNGENYVLVDIDGGDFDVAWHDDNHDNQIQENELIDISDSHISVNDFAQAANNGNDDNISSNNDNLIAENNMDPMDAGEIDYMDTSDTSGLV